MTTSPSKSRPLYTQNVISVGSPKRLVRPFKSSARWFQMVLDPLLVASLLYFHTWLKGIPFNADYRMLAVLTLLLMGMVYHVNDVYRFSTSVFKRFAALARAWTIVLSLLIGIGFATKTSSNFSREVFLTWAVTGFLAQNLSYLMVRRLLATTSDSILPTLIVGTGKLAQHLAAQINDNPWIPDRVVGLVAEHHSARPGDSAVDIVGTVGDLPAIIANQRIKRVYIALSMKDSGLLADIHRQLENFNADIIWAPDIFAVDMLNYSVSALGGVPVISFSETPLIGSNVFLKTVVDFSLASTLLILASPLMLLTAVLIKLSSPGPILFKQQRHGWYGDIITIYKFRSMKLHEEQDGNVTQATKDDARITWIGKIIRRTSIDELPQLFNVIKGSMSIVGPRPHAVPHNKFYSENIKDYMRRHRVKPGLTGLAQVNGHRGRTQSIEDMEKRVRNDLDYINNWSIWLDFKIMIKTLFVLFGKNAY